MITYKKYGFSIVLVLAASLLATGCAEKKPSEKIVATINDYRMTVEDFNYESKEILNTAKLFVGVPVTREDVLDALIIKEVLLQEAQDQGLDKEKNFMRTIELYWEQTLIKNLMARRARQIESAVAIYENEIQDYHNKMKNSIRANVLVLAEEKAGRKLLALGGDAAEFARKDPEKYSLLYTIPSKLYTLGESGSSLENSIFSVDMVKNRDLVAINGNWALITIEERIPIEPEPLSDARETIVNNIKLQKQKDLMNEWMETLRSNARVTIDKKVLSELK